MAAVALSWQPSARAIEPTMQMSGAGLSDVCTRPTEAWVSFCNGYIQAVIDGIRKDDRICVPKYTTRTDIVEVVEREITSSSKLKELNAKDAVMMVLRSVYPCP